MATVEWIGAVVCVTLVLGAAGATAGDVDGRSYAGWLAHTLACAVTGGCDDGELVAAYGKGDAELVREFAPNVVYEPGTYTLPVDFRECRSHRCSDAPDERDLDVHRAKRGDAHATVFTHVVRRGGETFIQYWLYYPDSTSTVLGAAGIWSLFDKVDEHTYPGFHKDDWEGYQVRVAGDGTARVRATSHRGYQWCKQRRCRNTWGEWTGWTRVSRGSHAGHIPTPRVDPHERTTTSAGLRLVPIESIDTGSTGPWDGVKPPWRKEVYDDPTSNSTS